MEESASSCVGPPLPTGAIIFGSILVAGVVISYALQMISIFFRKSSEGLSYLTLGLALFSSLLTCINFIILNWSRITCCFSGAISAATCLQNNLTTMQLAFGALCLFVIYIQLLVYFPLRKSDASQKEFLLARITIYATVFLWVVLSVVGITMHFWLELSDSTLAIYGKVIGIISAVVVVIQWSPQIYTTWKLESAGALSIPMLLLQMPGSLSTVFFQAFVDGADFSTWGPYLVSAIEQAVLVIMCMAFWCKTWANVQSYDDLLALEDEDDISYSALPGSTASTQNSFDVQSGFGTVAKGNNIFYHGSGSHEGPYKDPKTK